MGAYKYIRNLWKSPGKNLKEIYAKRIVEWRSEPSALRIEYPTRIDRARSLGYRAKEGYLLYRVKVLKGAHKRLDINHGRKPKNRRSLKVLHLNYQTICERRLSEKTPNLEVLNSYYAGQDGQHVWYEVIMVDKAHPAILADPRINWIASPKQNRRVFRGLTSSQKRSRGLLWTGKGAEKVRPSSRQR